MKVTVIGAGYVGLVSAACLAEVGHDVLCIDIDEARVERLRNGDIPIHEPGLDVLVRQSVAAGLLRFSSSIAEGAAHGRVQMIAVGTPADEDGSADLSHLLAATRALGNHLETEAVIVTKSTVPVGSGDQVEDLLRETLQARGRNVPFAVVSNPEFLKEGAAVEDFRRPDRIVVGTDSAGAERVMRELYAPLQRQSDRMVVMSRRSAELTKYAANAMLATRISFMNELALLADSIGADIEEVRRGVGSDPRIGSSFLFPGTGFGGSCFPKDLKALLHTAQNEGCRLAVLAAVQAVNERQKQILVARARQVLGDLRGRRFGLWGLAFKPDTDDMREAPSRAILEALWAEGAVVQAYDPLAMDECRRIYGARNDLLLAASRFDALTGVDALFIATEAKMFRAPAIDEFKQRMKRPVIFDGRNLFDPRSMVAEGIEYHCIGRSTAATR
ncbi:MAG: UDP-glucose/GDP-mannose dehydrogenase family protein [Lautropia sp.]